MICLYFVKSKTPYNKDVILHLLFKKSILKKIRELYRNEKAYRSITINIYNRIYRSVPIKYIVYFVIYICRCSIFITIVGISFVIFIENRSPQSTLAWFLVLALLPIIGVLLYAIFGRDRWRRKNISIVQKNKENYSVKY